MKRLQLFSPAQDSFVVPELNDELFLRAESYAERLQEQGCKPIYPARLREMHERLSVIYERISKNLGSSQGLESVCLCAVSKTVDLDDVLAAWILGLRHFGENRPQELARKYDALVSMGIQVGSELYFHQIGNLQRNKIKLVVGRTELIHSVDSLSLASSLNSYAEQRGMLQDILLQLNISGEESKSGMTAEELSKKFPEFLALDSLRIHGLMTMAPRRDEEGIQQSFSGLAELAAELQADFQLGHELILSMGMSEDYEEALREGAHIIRLGRSIFS